MTFSKQYQKETISEYRKVYILLEIIKIMENRHREVYINYDGKLYTLDGDARVNDTNFSEIVELLLYMVEDKEHYNFVINDNARLELSQTEENILEKIIKINNKINLIKAAFRNTPKSRSYQKKT